VGGGDQGKLLLRNLFFLSGITASAAVYRIPMQPGINGYIVISQATVPGSPAGISTPVGLPGGFVFPTACFGCIPQFAGGIPPLTGSVSGSQGPNLGAVQLAVSAPANLSPFNISYIALGY
jgi:hypothetical protein